MEFPHEGGCIACREEHRCNHCGTLVRERCTNGRCAACHGTVCGTGGEHAFWRNGGPAVVYAHDKDEFWRDHGCWRCNDGAKPCPQGGHHRCEYPRARND